MPAAGRLVLKKTNPVDTLVRTAVDTRRAEDERSRGIRKSLFMRHLTDAANPKIERWSFASKLLKSVENKIGKIQNSKKQRKNKYKLN